MTDKLDDVWASRDFPVLVATAKLINEGERHVMARQLSKSLDLGTDEVLLALDGLVPTYLTGKPLDSLGGRTDFLVNGITERGRRAVGLWPSGEGVDALVDALRKAENTTDDPEEKTVLRRAAGAVGSVSRDIMVDVVAAVVSRQSGLG
jgi:hypothetical protein